MKNLIKKSFMVLSVTFGSSVWALSPPNISTDIEWSAPFGGVTDIAAAYNNGRRQEEIQLGLSVNSLGNLDLPSQADWDKMTDDAKALWILNEERSDRAGMEAGVIGLPFAGTESHIDNISKNYGDLSHDNDRTGHYWPTNNHNLDGPSIRIEQDADIGSLHRAAISYTANNGSTHSSDNSPHFFGDTKDQMGACHEFNARSENLAYFATSGNSIPLPLERALYGFIYDDADSNWGHREAALLQDETLSQAGSGWGFSNNQGSLAHEGYLGISVRGSTDYQPFPNFASVYATIVVMNIFDPIPTTLFDPEIGEFPILNNPCHYNVTLKNENIGNDLGKVPTLSVPNNQWVQIGLNTQPATGSTVADILGDDISATYDTDWVVFSYLTDTDAYKKLSLTDTMEPGVGYWLIQETGAALTIDMPSSSSGVYVTYSPACTSTEGCFEIPLQSKTSGTQWQMIGYPFRDNRDMSGIRIVTSSGDCSGGCTLSDAGTKNLSSDRLWHYDGVSSYEELSDGGSDQFEPWDGAWFAILPALGLDAKMLIPAKNFDGFIISPPLG